LSGPEDIVRPNAEQDYGDLLAAVPSYVPSYLATRPRATTYRLHLWWVANEVADLGLD
jgi:hypothetical protein